MATISLMAFISGPHFSLRPPLFHCLRKVKFSSAVAAMEMLEDPDRVVKEQNSADSTSSGKRKLPKWKKLDSKELGISSSMIAKPTRKVLNCLKQKGFEVYLVGGCVRDLILKRIPKDFDIITSAELKQVVRAFSWCEIVGKRFPICHVHIDGTIVEVSSFSTRGRNFSGVRSNDPDDHVDCDERDHVRWRNCLERDFTINGLMFDPYARIVYDYMGGLEDMKKAKVRTVIPAVFSFQEDCARILRAVRVAARLGFRFSRETAHFVKHFSGSILRLDKGRLLMEINYMLAYGSAEASLRILWKFGLLEILLPIQAAYLVRSGFKRRDRKSNMLLSLFGSLDKLIAPDKPCHSSLWVGLLAFHKALSEQPRDPMVVAAFCLAVHNGGDLSEAMSIARRINKLHDSSFHELCKPQKLNSEDLIDEVKNLANLVKRKLYEMNDEHCVSQAMADYPQAPHSDLVFIPLTLYLQACKLFACVKDGPERGFVPKQGSEINYHLLAAGSLQEVRHIFARVVFDTVFPVNRDV